MTVEQIAASLGFPNEFSMLGWAIVLAMIAASIGIALGQRKLKRMREEADRSMFGASD